MFCIKYTVGDYTGLWCDPCIRGNVEPLTYHDRGNADNEASDLNRQYNNEGYKFFVAEHEKVLTT